MEFVFPVFDKNPESGYLLKVGFGVVDGERYKWVDYVETHMQNAI